MWRAFCPSLRSTALVRPVAAPSSSFTTSRCSFSVGVQLDPSLRARALQHIAASAPTLPLMSSRLTDSERAQKVSEALAIRLAKLQATHAKTANLPPTPIAQHPAQAKPKPIAYPLNRRWLPIREADSGAAASSSSSASSSAAAAASPTTLPADALPLTLLSYNLLAQSLVRRDLFPYSSRSSLKVAFRRDNLLAELLEADADVMALQEVDADLMANFWSKKLEAAGYKWEWGSRKENAKHGCAIFYKKAKFERFTSVVIQYAEELGAPYADLPDNQGEEWSQRRGSVYEEMARPNVGQIVGLRVKETSASSAPPMGLYVCNTHLFWDPRYRFVRLKQCQTLLDRLASLQNAEGTSYPSVLLGDFNVTPDNIIYNYLTAREELQHNEECWGKFLTPAEHGSMGRGGDSEAAAPVVDPQEAKANAGISAASLARLVQAVSLNPSSSPSPSPSPSPPGTTTALPFGGNTPLQQLRTELVQQADGSVKVHDVEPHVDHSAPSSVLRLSEVKAVLHHSKQLPLLQSLYANYAQIVPADAQGSLARSQASSYCRWSKEPPYTNYTQKFKGTLDYIFLPVHNPASDLDDPEAEAAAAGAGADVATARSWSQILSSPSCYLQPTHLLELPAEELLMEATALPNDVVSSDHVCIAARVVMSRTPMRSPMPTPPQSTAVAAATASTSAASSAAPAVHKASPNTTALAKSIAESLLPRPLPPAALSAAAAPASFAAFKPALFYSLNRAQHIGKVLHYESTVTSTMDLCKDALFGPDAGKKPESGTIWLADEQTKGRGRIEGRSWSSPGCANLYFTLLIQLPSSGALQASAFEALRKMNQCVCLSVAQSIESSLQAALGLSPSQRLPPALQPKIKWPNDVWIGGKKCCGVLIDVEHCAGEMNVVIGVGINVHEDMRSHPDAALRESATSVAQALREYLASNATASASSSSAAAAAPSTPLSRESLLASFVSHLDQLAPQSLSSVLSLYARYDMLLGHRIVVMPRKREDTESYYSALAVGYSPDGYLIVQTDAGERKELVAEEVTIRPAKDEATTAQKA